MCLAAHTTPVARRSEHSNARREKGKNADGRTGSPCAAHRTDHSGQCCVSDVRAPHTAHSHCESSETRSAVSGAQSGELSVQRGAARSMLCAHLERPRAAACPRIAHAYRWSSHAADGGEGRPVHTIRQPQRTSAKKRSGGQQTVSIRESTLRCYRGCGRASKPSSSASLRARPRRSVRETGTLPVWAP